MRGRVFWITGLSNSGKTTIGTALYYDLKRNGKNVIILDGDLMKQIASGSENAGYSLKDRMIRSKRYSMMAKLLADQGYFVIVCAIAMFDEIRDWNRKNIKGYIEIYLNVNDEILKMRDRKGLFDKNLDVQLPKNSDLVINNDGSIPLREIVKLIKEVKPLNEDDYDRDTEYWNGYYKELNGLIKPSDFAITISKMIKPRSQVLELGCGNGRDSLYFLEQGHNVIAIDGSDVAIEKLNEVTKDKNNILFICDDFVKCHIVYQMKYDCIYSRFTLHAITEAQEDELLINVKEGLTPEGIFCIEARTINDDIYGKGKKVAHNAFIYNNHYRRFINTKEFCEKLRKNGFEIIYVEERDGFSKTNDSNPVLMRCVVTLGNDD